MSDWLTCTSCGLKHSLRPDGVCPRCKAPTGMAAQAVVTNPYAPPQQQRIQLPIPIPTAVGFSALRQIALAQRKMTLGYCIGFGVIAAAPLLGGIAEVFGSKPLVVLAALVMVGGAVVWHLHNSYRCYKMASALGSSSAVLWGLGGLVPGLISLIVILVLSRRASAILRAEGVHVGLFGVRPDIMDAL